MQNGPQTADSYLPSAWMPFSKGDLAKLTFGSLHANPSKATEGRYDVLDHASRGERPSLGRSKEGKYI